MIAIRRDGRLGNSTRERLSIKVAHAGFPLGLPLLVTLRPWTGVRVGLAVGNRYRQRRIASTQIRAHRCGALGRRFDADTEGPASAKPCKVYLAGFDPDTA